MTPQMTYGAFAEKLRAKASDSIWLTSAADTQFLRDVATVKAHAKAWVLDPEFHQRELVYLDLMLRIIEAEIDRPFERWYGMHPHVNRPHLRRLCDRLSTAGPGTSQQKVADALTIYIRETGFLWQAGLSRPWGAWAKLTRWRDERTTSGPSGGA
jgi:hypothetical protein